MTEAVQAGLRPPDERRRRLVDIAIAVVVTVAQLGAAHATWSWGNTSRAAASSAPGWPGYLLLTVAGLVLIFRRRFPVPVLAVSLGATLLAGAISHHPGMTWIALIVAFFNAVVAGKRLAAIASLVIGYAASQWPLWQIGRAGHSSVAVAVAVAAWLLVLLAVAEFVRFRRDRSAELARSRAEQLRRQASEERMRIARDLHDVVAHNISVINVQANTALHLMDRQPERAREALTAIHDVSRQALTELRSVLGVLRSDEDYAPRAPSPGLGQLDDLLSAVRKAGLDARLHRRGDLRQLPASLDLAAYRIVQEALTNTARHSASRAADVLVSYEADGVLVQVDDAGPARSPAAAQAGNGITGMAERAHALGGRLSAGRRPDGGFRVAAWLPSPAPAGAQASPQVEPLEARQQPDGADPSGAGQPGLVEPPGPPEGPQTGESPDAGQPGLVEPLEAGQQPGAGDPSGAGQPGQVEPPGSLVGPQTGESPDAGEPRDAGQPPSAGRPS